MKKKTSRFITGGGMITSLMIIPMFTMGAASPPMMTPSHVGATPGAVRPMVNVQLPNGAHQFKFVIAGLTNTVLTPPVNFHPLTATNAQLKAYGFPARPTSLAELATWEKAMGAWRSAPVPKLTVTNIYNNMRIIHAPDVHNGVEQSSNWSGYFTSSSYNQWDAAQGFFVQPTDYSTSSNKYESSWVGLGGVNSGALIQDGTQMNAGQYGAWYEYLGNGGAGVPEINFNSINVNPGDQMYTYVSYNPNDGNAYFYVEDESNGTSQSATVNLGSNYYDGTTAEWINERPEIGSQLSQLADYGSQGWTGAQAYNAYTGNWDNLGNETNNSIDMYSSAGNLLSQAGNLQSSTSFTDTWVASGN